MKGSSFLNSDPDWFAKEEEEEESQSESKAFG